MKTQETIRNDGLHIITCNVPSKKAYIELVAHVGSAYDPPHQQGLFHYFEHMAFKGTQQRTVEEIRSFSRHNVLSSNASTGRMETTYYGTAVYKKCSRLCDFLCDLYFNSTFPEEEIKREQEVVLNEIARDQDKDNYAAYQKLWEALWRKNPLRIFGVGTPEGVQSVDRAALTAAKNKWYIPSNTLAIAVGRVDHDEFVNEINNHVPESASMATHAAWQDEYNELPNQQEIIVKRPQREKATLVFGCKFPLYTDDRHTVTGKFLEYALVVGSGSLLWRELREKRGLAYSLSGGISAIHPLGAYFSVYVETLPNRVDAMRELVPLILFQPFTDQKIFEETKEYLSDWFSLGCEGLNDWASLIRNELRKGRTLKSTQRRYQRFCKAISLVTLDEIEDLRKTTLAPKRFTTVVIKPS